MFVAQEQWEEAQHELGRRLPVLVARARLDEAQRRELEDEVAVVADAVLEVVPAEQ